MAKNQKADTGAKTKKRNPWLTVTRIRAIVQLLALIFFVGLLWASPATEVFFRADPLAGISASIASRSLIFYFLPSLAIIGLTIACGRIWCGWLCPMGTILDLFKFKKRQSRRANAASPFFQAHDKSLKKIKYIVLIVMLCAALFGNLSLMFLDPLAIVTRTLTASVIPGINHAVTGVEKSLYGFEQLSPALDAFDGAIRGTFLPIRQSFFIFNIALTIIFSAILIANLFARRFWCRYVCPIGAGLGFLSRFSFFKRSVTAPCSECASCKRACDVGAIADTPIDNQTGYESDNSECIVCFDCYAKCPAGKTSFSFLPEPAKTEVSLPSRRSFLGGIGAAAIGVTVLNGSIIKIRPNKTLLRPPGVLNEAKFLSSCIRCDQCLRVCPTSGLQLSIADSGLEGFMTPRLVPRLGACDYNCNLCGKTCPSGAIPALAVEVKQTTPIGKAVIEAGRCIEWATGAECLVCREFCPLPKKAVERRQMIGTDQNGGKIISHGPYVYPDRCIGCGICENLCPIEGEAAIRVMRAITK